MPIDVGTLLAADPIVRTSSWTADDVILYHLAIGAGDPPTDPGELAYAYERELKVLPSFAVLPVLDMVVSGLTGLPGLDVDLASVLHGEHELEIHAPVPGDAEVTSTMRVADVIDKGKAALLVFEVRTESSDGTLLFVNRFSSFVRGEGGVGRQGESTLTSVEPDRAPDVTVERPTLPQQGLLYRLTGDKNPMHADPAFAARGGFERPILHGLCSFGIACKAATDEVLDGDVARIQGYSGRFAGVVFPGETLVIDLWREEADVFIRARTKERGAFVLSNASITLN